MRRPEPTRPEGTFRNRLALLAERGAWAFGLVCVVTWGALYIGRREWCPI